jgi:hypothetical protein
LRRTHAMFNLTYDHVINTYWQHAQEVVDNGFVAFILRGSLSWESPERRRVTSADGALWLQSDLYDPVGRHIAEEPVRRHMRFDLNLSDIWGGLRTEIHLGNAEEARDALELAVRDISLLANLVSFHTGASMSWLPARYLEMNVKPAQPPVSDLTPRRVWLCVPLSRYAESHEGISADDKFVEHCLIPLFDLIRAIRNDKLATVIRRAIAWHAGGNYLSSGLNRFVNLWESIELLGQFFYSKLKPNVLGLPSREERRNELFALLSGPSTLENCWTAGEQAAQIVRPSIRRQLEAALPIITGDSTLGDSLFVADPENQKSMYDLRNDIAHGNYSDHDIAFTEVVHSKLYDIRELSCRIILAVLQRAGTLSDLLTH